MDYFEDFSVNQRFTFGRYTVTRDEIVGFAYLNMIRRLFTLMRVIR